MHSETLVLAFCYNTVYSLTRSPEHTSCRFGGPLDRRLTGVAFGTSPLHLLAELDLHLTTRRGPHQLPVFSLPLIYGLRYSGCELAYRVKSTGWVEITEICPKESSDDFPYPDYPSLLPYAPLQVSDAREVSYAEFASKFPNMPEKQSAELVVCVPPPATLGVSVWGPLGDLDGVTVVFECSPVERSVRAYNRCT